MLASSENWQAYEANLRARLATANEKQLVKIRDEARQLVANARAVYANPYRRYQSDPEAYARDVLGVSWWHKQTEIANALLTHKRVLVKAGNGPGKSFLAGGLINWFFDSFAQGICLSTAPTAQQVQDVLWKEVRRQRRGRPGMQPKAPRMEDAPDHYAAGYTARDANAFQGRHMEPLFLIFDEGTGVESQFYEAGEGMQPTYWLVLLNPTDTTCYAYTLESKADWHTITLNSFEHPNIVAELAGLPVPYPQASLRLDWLRARVLEWCDPIPAEDSCATDIEFDGQWWRPGGLFESRVLGRWVSQGTDSVWSEALWDAATVPQEIPDDAELVLSCDVARFGDDYTEIMARRGNCVFHHEAHNGWDLVRTAGRLKQLARELGKGKATSVPIFIDDDGVGGGVTDNRGEYCFVGVGAGLKAIQIDDYHRSRDEIWFTSALRAKEGRIDVSRLSDTSRRNLRSQLLAVKYGYDSEGRRKVEPKEETKKRLGRSPDTADAFNLLFSGRLRAKGVFA